MKKTILQITLCFCAFFSKAQLTVADFETFTLATNSVYQSSVSAPFLTTNASFQYKWDTQFNYWLGGFTYSNMYDTVTVATQTVVKLFGVIPYKGYNNSNIYVVGQDKGLITMASAQNTVDGFYITNTTYAVKSMRHGDQFAKKFGGPSGNDPDYFKVTVKGYDNGVMKQDSVEFYLADFRFGNNGLDYIVDTWQWFNASSLGEVDSIRFFMYSSDANAFGINTPGFFGIDNFTTKGAIVGVEEFAGSHNIQVYPNPFKSTLNLNFDVPGIALINVYDANGKTVSTKQNSGNAAEIDLSGLAPGVYFLEIKQNGEKVTKRIIKE